MHDQILRWLRRMGRPPDVDQPPVNLDVIDRRLDSVEQEQRRIDARLLLLERQADPRGWQHGG